MPRADPQRDLRKILREVVKRDQEACHKRLRDSYLRFCLEDNVQQFHSVGSLYINGAIRAIQQDNAENAVVWIDELIKLSAALLYNINQGVYTNE